MISFAIGSQTAIVADKLKMPPIRPIEKFTGKPGPKYGHLSDIHPVFAPLKEATDAQFAVSMYFRACQTF